MDKYRVIDDKGVIYGYVEANSVDEAVDAAWGIDCPWEGSIVEKVPA